MKRVEANDAGAMDALATDYYHGVNGLQQDWAEAMDLWFAARSGGGNGPIYKGSKIWFQ